MLLSVESDLLYYVSEIMIFSLYILQVYIVGKITLLLVCVCVCE